MAFGTIAVTAPPATADAPTVYLRRTIELSDPAPPGSPAAGMPASGPRRITLAAGKYNWCVSLTSLGDNNECLVFDLRKTGDYNWRCYLSHYNQNTYRGNCVLDLLPAGASTPAGDHYYTLPAGGAPRYWAISGTRYYGWESSLDPWSF
ncbi:hypothetical protein [Nonomuraea fuscirosea]|uniref:hypothetical protein n=1 Tax=Nonomuraea fuscirosea TaxID=1291556 RepID=UPI003442EFEE